MTNTATATRSALRTLTALAIGAVLAFLVALAASGAAAVPAAVPAAVSAPAIAVDAPAAEPGFLLTFPAPGQAHDGDYVRTTAGVASWDAETGRWVFCPNGW